MIVISQAETAQRVRLRWEAFDAHSFRIASGKAENGTLDVRPKEKVEWTFDVEPAAAEEAKTIKVTALNEHGQGAVKLVDWHE